MQRRLWPCLKVAAAVHASDADLPPQFFHYLALAETYHAAWSTDDGCTFYMANDPREYCYSNRVTSLNSRFTRPARNELERFERARHDRDGDETLPRQKCAVVKPLQQQGVRCRRGFWPASVDVSRRASSRSLVLDPDSELLFSCCQKLVDFRSLIYSPKHMEAC